MKEITISDSASARISQLLQKEPAENVFRISVLGGGCSGFSYKFEFGARAEDDITYQNAGAEVVIDPTSFQILEGSHLDFISELGGQYFAMKNPNATSTCGCGSSFAV
jgi:iron-sulfur cluster assembly accessory protein